MLRKIVVVVLFGTVSTVSAQMRVNFTEAFFAPEDYLDQEVVFSRVFAGDMFNMNLESGGGDTFLLRIEDDVRNFVGGPGAPFVPILPERLARQWEALELGSVELRRSNVHGRLYRGEHWIILEINKIEMLSATGAVLDVID